MGDASHHAVVVLDAYDRARMSCPPNGLPRYGK